jgi:hypothetical protein
MQVDTDSWKAAYRFRVVDSEGQSRVFEVDARGGENSSSAISSVYSQWVGALSEVALVNLEKRMKEEASALREAAEQNTERIAESRRIQASIFQVSCEQKFYSCRE